MWPGLEIASLQMSLAEMRSYLTRMGPYSRVSGVMERCPVEDRCTLGECHVTSQAKTGVRRIKPRNSKDG